MNIVKIIQEHAQNIPNKKAIIEIKSGKENSITFEELEIKSSKLANLFKNSGLKAGDSILLFLPMSIDLYIILVAIFRLKLTAIFIDPYAGVNYIERCCKLYSPKALITSSKVILFSLFLKSIRQISIKFSIGLRLPNIINLKSYHKLKDYSEIKTTESQTPALITFTSGSTDLPKVIVRSHDFLLNQHKILLKTLCLYKSDKVLISLPIFVLSHLGSGITSILPAANIVKPASINARPIIRQIIKNKASVLILSPAMLEKLIAYCESKNIKLDSIKQVFTGGAPVFPKLLARSKNKMLNSEIIAVYGSSEAEPIAHITYDEISEKDIQFMKNGKGLLVGKPIEDIDLKIIPNSYDKPLGPFTEDQLEKFALANNHYGEIIVQGKHVLTGYLNDNGNEETKIKVDNKIWHRTGDAGYLDKQNRLWLLGRSSAVIKKTNIVLYPFQIECALSWNSKIQRSALILYQDKIVLLLQIFNKLEKEAIKNEVITALPDIKIDLIHFIDKIPVDKRHNSKTDYKSLRKIINKIL